MIKTGRYFISQMKRTFRAFPFVLAVTAALFAALALAGNAYIGSLRGSDSRMHLKIGVVGNMDSSYNSLGMNAIKNIDSTRFAIEFEEMDENSAKEKLINKELTAYAVIPDDFVREISRGRISKIRYCTTSGAANVITILKDEIASEVSSLMIASQKGVFGAREALSDSNISSESADSLSDKLNLRYISFLMQREELFKIEETGTSDGLSAEGGFICGASIFFLMIWGLGCATLFSRRDITLPRLLAAKRFSAARQIICEYSVYFLLMLCSVFPIICLLALSGIDISGLTGGFSGGADFLHLFFEMLPAMLAISAFQFCLYTASHGISGGMLLQFLAAVALSYVSGCLYPIGFLPEIFSDISAFTPSGIARVYLSDCLTFGADGLTIASLLICTALFLALGVLIRRTEIRRRAAL